MAYKSYICLTVLNNFYGYIMIYLAYLDIFGIFGAPYDLPAFVSKPPPGELEVMHQCSNDADERLDTLRRHFNERIRAP